MDEAVMVEAYRVSLSRVRAGETSAYELEIECTSIAEYADQPEVLWWQGELYERSGWKKTPRKSLYVRSGMLAVEAAPPETPPPLPAPPPLPSITNAVLQEQNRQQREVIEQLSARIVELKRDVAGYDALIDVLKEENTKLDHSLRTTMANHAQLKDDNARQMRILKDKIRLLEEARVKILHLDHDAEILRQAYESLLADFKQQAAQLAQTRDLLAQYEK